MTSLKANDYSNPEYIGSKFRKKRFKFFEENWLSQSKQTTIIDISAINNWIFMLKCRFKDGNYSHYKLTVVHKHKWNHASH